MADLGNIANFIVEPMSVLGGIFWAFDICIVLYIFISLIQDKKSKDRTDAVKMPENVPNKITDSKFAGHYFDGENIYSVSP